MAKVGRLAICLLNISEAVNRQTVERVALAATKDTTTANGSTTPCMSSVLNIFQDIDYNRSVLTIAASVEHLKHAVCNACEEAYRLIDLTVQDGVHPRLGSVDLIPIYPLTESVSLEECGRVAHSIALHLSDSVPGTSFFLFGDADQPQCRGVVERRKEVGWFRGKHGIDWSKFSHDLGPAPTARYGLTGAGSSHYVMNCNVTIRTEDLNAGRSIASAIRASSPGGLPGVQAMAFPHEGNIEIACNVDSIKSKREAGEILTQQSNNGREGGEAEQDTPIILDYTPPGAIEQRVKQLAAEKQIGLVGTALVGFRPEEACRLARAALQTGQDQFWKTRDIKTM